jgi:hypothetical protein
MGAWGFNSFENDAAADWLGDLRESGDSGLIRNSLQAVFPKPPGFLGKLMGKRSSYLDADGASAALVAAEVVAALRGKPHAKLPPEVEKFVADNDQAASTALSALAFKAVQRIRAESELCELWQESEDFELWQAELESLEQRLLA